MFLFVDLFPDHPWCTRISAVGHHFEFGLALFTRFNAEAQLLEAKVVTGGNLPHRISELLKSEPLQRKGGMFKA